MKTIIIDEIDNFTMTRIMSYLHSGSNYSYLDEGVYHGDYVKVDDIIDKKFLKSGCLAKDFYKHVNFKIISFINHPKVKEKERKRKKKKEKRY